MMPQSLPHDVLVDVFDDLPLDDLLCCARTCGEWHRAVQSTRQYHARVRRPQTPLDRFDRAAEFERAVADRDLPAAKWFFSTRDDGEAEDFVLCTARRGWLRLLKWILALHKNPRRLVWNPQQLAEVACAADRDEVVKFLFEEHPEWQRTWACFDAACARGNDELAKWLIERHHTGLPADEARALNSAHDFGMARWLQRRFRLRELGTIPSGRPPPLLLTAFRSGDVEFVRWAMNEFGVTPNLQCMTAAAACGHLPLLKLFWRRPRFCCTWDVVRLRNEVLKAACRAGQHVVIDWLRPTTFGADSTLRSIALENAVIHDQPDVFCRLIGRDWMRFADDPDVLEPAFRAACRRGNVAILKLIRKSLDGDENERFWHTDDKHWRFVLNPLHDACTTGHLEAAKYLLRHAADFTALWDRWTLDPLLSDAPHTLRHTLEHGHLATALWMMHEEPTLATRARIFERDGSVLRIARARGHSDVVAWLEKQQPALARK